MDSGKSTWEAWCGVSRRPRKRTAGRIALALTANRFYALDGVRAGAKLSAVAHRLHVQRPPFHVGLNFWYVVPGNASRGVLKVRHGRIQEVGVVARGFTNGRAAQRRLFRSLSAG